MLHEVTEKLRMQCITNFFTKILEIVYISMYYCNQLIVTRACYITMETAFYSEQNDIKIQWSLYHCLYEHSAWSDLVRFTTNYKNHRMCWVPVINRMSNVNFSVPQSKAWS